MKKFSTIIILFFAGVLTLFVSACQTQKPYEVSTTPQYFIGKIKYTGPVFSPVGTSKPYTFAFYDINNSFVAYIDFSRVLISNMEPYLDKTVAVQGIFSEDDKGNFLIKAQNLKASR